MPLWPKMFSIYFFFSIWRILNHFLLFWRILSCNLFVIFSIFFFIFVKIFFSAHIPVLGFCRFENPTSDELVKALWRSRDLIQIREKISTKDTSYADDYAYSFVLKRTWEQFLTYYWVHNDKSMTQSNNYWPIVVI